MKPNTFESETDFVKAAALHLRQKASERGLKIGSSHAHALIAASLGYKSPVALKAPNSAHSSTNQWLSREGQDISEIQAAIARMRETSLKEEDVPFLAATIRDGLTPPCSETGIRSFRNLPLGNVETGEDTEWVHPSTAHNDSLFGNCRCCGSDVLYRLDDLDDQMLCNEHRGEFDLDHEEQKDWDDLVENLSK